MLGYTLSNNDVYIFFEDDEIGRLPGGVVGKYFNLICPHVVGALKASVDDSIPDLITTPTTKDAQGFVTEMSLLMRKNVYEKLVSRGTAGTHEGFRHIELLDANRLSFHDKMNYQQVKALESQLK